MSVSSPFWSSPIVGVFPHQFPLPEMGTSSSRESSPTGSMVSADSGEEILKLRDEIIRRLSQDLIQEITAATIRGYDPEGVTNIQQKVEHVVRVSVPGLGWIRYYLETRSALRAMSPENLNRVITAEGAQALLRELSPQNPYSSFYERSLSPFVQNQ